MLTQPQLQRFAHESGIRNLEIIEKEVVLTYFLQLLSERGFLADMAFKGGTCIRKTWLDTAVCISRQNERGRSCIGR